MRTRLAVLAVLLVPLVSGCSSANHRDAEAVATRFYDAYGNGKGSTACAMLAPATRKAVEQSAGEPCASGLLKEQLPHLGTVTATYVYGDQAQVRLDGDTVFVARFPGGWKVVAAGCTARPGLPYECQVEAG